MIPSSITVRGARPEDLGPVSRFAGELLRQHHAFDGERFLEVKHPEEGYRHFLGGELKDPRAVVVVAEENGVVVGYAYGRIEPRNWNDLLDSCGKIHDVFVDPSMRGRNVGAALMRELMARLKALGAPRVVLLTATQNVGAHKVFAKLGFRVTMLEMTCELP